MEDEGQSSERQASQSQRSSAASLQAEEARLPGMSLCAWEPLCAMNNLTIIISRASIIIRHFVLYREAVLWWEVKLITLEVYVQTVVPYERLSSGGRVHYRRLHALYDYAGFI